MKRVVIERCCLFSEGENAFDDRNIRNAGKVIISEQRDRRNVYVNHRLLAEDAVEVLDCLSVLGYSLTVISELSVKETQAKLEQTMIDPYFSGSFSSRNTDAHLREIAAESDDFSVVVCRSEEIISAARKLKIPTIRVLNETITEKGSATITAERFGVVDDVVIQAVMFDEISRKIRALDRCRLIGIDGIELVGKTYFSSKLSSFLKLHGMETTVVRLSEFKSPIEVTYKGEDEAEAFYFHAFNVNKLMDELLLPFLENGTVDVVLTSFQGNNSRHGIESHYKIDPGGVMILQGELMYREPLMDLFDFKIFLFMDEQEAMHRALVRDLFLGEETKEAEFKIKRVPAQKMYMQRHIPVERCEYAIDNTNYRRPIILREVGGCSFPESEYKI